MIALDTSSLVSFLAGEQGRDVEALDLALEQKQGVLPPVVLADMLSDPRLPASVAKLLLDLPLLPLGEGFWERAGLLRSRLIRKGRKAHLADSLIAQVCIDHDVPLITRDADFGAIARSSSLRLFP
jgi:predicted nucleic acid-binding protein